MYVNSRTKNSDGKFWKKLITTKGCNARWRRKRIRQQIHLKRRYTLPSDCITSLLSRRRPRTLHQSSVSTLQHGDLITFLSLLLGIKDNNLISHFLGRVIPQALRLRLLNRMPMWDLWWFLWHYEHFWYFLFRKFHQWFFIIHVSFRPASWSDGQSFWLLTTRSRVRFPALPWEFFRVRGGSPWWPWSG